MSEAPGLGDPVWMAKMIVAHAPAILLRKAVMQLFDAYESEEVVTGFDSINRIVQVASTGVYYPEKCEHDHGVFSEELSEEEEALVDEWVEKLNDILKDRDEEEENE